MIAEYNLRQKEYRMKMRNKSFLTIFLIIALTTVGFITILLQASSVIDVFNRLGILLLFIVCIYKGRKESYLFNPYYLFSITPLSLLIYFKSVSPYYLTNLSQSTWSIAFYNISMFIIGLSLISSYKSMENSIKNTNHDNSFNIKNLLFHTKLFLLLGMLPTIYGFFIGFPTLLSGNLYGMKVYATALPLASVLTLFKYPAIAYAIKSKNKKTIVFTLLLCIFDIFINFNKFQIGLLLFVVLISNIKYSMRTNRVNVRIFIYILFAALILFWSFDYYDSLRGYDTANYLIKANRVSGSINKRLILPYLYLTTPWVNLQFVMETSTSHTYGLWVLKPFINYFQLDGLFIEQYTLIPRSTFNTFNYISVLFKDFGFIGSGIISLLLGLMIKMIYTHFRKTTSPFAVAAYSLNAYAVFLMFFSNHFFMQSYPITILIMMMIYNVFRFKKKII